MACCSDLDAPRSFTPAHSGWMVGGADTRIGALVAGGPTLTLKLPIRVTPQPQRLTWANLGL